MNIDQQIGKFYELVHPSHPNEWELEEILEGLSGLSSQQQKELLNHVPAIWPISHSLCFSYLTEVPHALILLPVELLPEWVRQILSHYEDGGLRRARDFMADIEGNFLLSIKKKTEVSITELRGRLIPFLRGISGNTLNIEQGVNSSTDTQTIYVPRLLTLFSKLEENVLMYRFLVSCQWAFIAIKSLQARPGNHIVQAIEKKYGQTMLSEGEPMEQLFSLFPDPLLANDIFLILEFGRGVAFLSRELPGLMRATKEIRQKYILSRPEPVPGKCQFMEKLFSSFVLYDQKHEGYNEEAVSYLFQIGDGIERSLQQLIEIYAQLEKVKGTYELGDFYPLLGPLQFQDARKVIEERRMEKKDAFVALLADFLSQQLENQNEAENSDVSDTADSLMVSIAQELIDNKPNPTLKVNNEEVQLPEELVDLLSQIQTDLGELPDAYLSAAAGIAGKGRPAGEVPELEINETDLAKTHHFNEWDYRRVGYRKLWCSLHEKELELTRSNFVMRTLVKYSGQLIKIKRQFEMMRTQERFARRRRHGDDLDLDALIDSLGDLRAGLSPSERLFIRLIRDQRDIAALFLVDMSNSTEGWVGNTIKEALILLCEAMEVLGDRYGIYGFSGMRRSRNEVFHIKHLNEKYGDVVRERIGSIHPREYTRMGPPIRYMTRLFSRIEAKARILFILSDGKPEDYDDYKGEYAIEDTKKALIEAKGQGIHHYCITIDQHNHDYLDHMYGKGNYCFVKNIEMLPSRMTEIYRRLTRG